MKTWPNIHHEGLEMQPLTRWPHTQPQIIVVKIKGNTFWWTASCLLRHTENINTNRKQRGTWCCALKWWWGSLSKEIFISVLQVVKCESERWWPPQSCCWDQLPNLLSNSEGVIAPCSPFDPQLTFYNSCNTASLFILLFTFDIFTPPNSLPPILTTIEMLPKLGCSTPTGL